jgi:hypothetical protein
MIKPEQSLTKRLVTDSGMGNLAAFNPFPHNNVQGVSL